MGWLEERTHYRARLRYLPRRITNILQFNQIERDK